MRIGELASSVGFSVATIRFYEQEGLLDKPDRSDAGYRAYGDGVVERLGFIQRCRALGIGIAEIRRLIRLAEAPNADCGEVDVLLDEHIRKVQVQRRDLATLERDLRALRADCHPSGQVSGCGMLRSPVQPLGAMKQSASKSPHRRQK